MNSGHNKNYILTYFYITLYFIVYAQIILYGNFIILTRSMTDSLELLHKTWFTPTFSSLIKNRAENLAIVGAGSLQIGLHLAGLPGWACPFKSLFGIPCPGCGLTTAADQLIHGQINASLHTHAFASIFVLAFLVMAAAVFLPEKQRGNLVTWIAGFERRTGMTALVLSSLLIYWAIRLVGLFLFI